MSATRSQYGIVLIDKRFGDGDRFYVNPPRGIRMRVPNAVLKTVIFLGEDSAESIAYKATGYLVSVPGGAELGKVDSMKHLAETIPYPTTFMVTARHVAKKLKGKKFYVRANTLNGETARIEFGPETNWWYHPRDEQYVDSAAIPFWPHDFTQLDIAVIPLRMFVDEQIINNHRIEVGDEVFITGLFTETTETTRNIPIVRIETVAMIPGEKLPFKDGLIEAHLIECRSIGGLSGSPVFVRETLEIQSGVQVNFGKLRNNISDSCHSQSFDAEVFYGVGRFYFFGSTVGHWDLKNFSAVQAEAVNMGISAVVPASKIKEIILQEGTIELMKARCKEIEGNREAHPTYD